MPITREDIERARAQLGLSGGVQEASEPRTFNAGGGLGLAANAFRAVVPQGARDVLGTIGQDLFSAEEALNVPGIPLGSAIRSGLERSPIAGGLLGTAFDVGLAPATIGAAFIPGGQATIAGRLGITQGSRLGRIGFEAAQGLASVAGAGAAERALETAEERGVPVPGLVRSLGPLAAGIAAGGLTGRRIRGPAAVTEDALRAQFGDDVGGALNKFIVGLDEAKAARTPIRAARRADMERRAAQILSTKRRAGHVDRHVWQRAQRHLAGRRPGGQIEPLSEFVDEQDLNSLLSAIEFHPALGELTLTRQNLQGAILDMFDEGALPQPAQIAQLEEVFGKSFVQAIQRNLPVSTRVANTIGDALAVPRALMASVDISAPFRQGLLFSGRGEFWRAWRPMLRAFASDEGAEDALRQLRARPTAGLRRSAGLFEGGTSKAASRLTTAEEAFRSNLAEQIPGIGKLVRASDRAYVTFLNQLRADVFDSMAAKYARALATDDDYAKLARAINYMTGRGPLPGGLGTQELLTQAFFSPRLLLGRALTPGAIATTPGSYNPFIASARRELAMNAATVFGAGVTGLALAKISGIADVELDPRSSDFGKLRIGNSRIDPWGGYQQLARYMAQIATGEAVSSGSGNLRDINRFETGQDFIESKLAPVPGLVVDLVRGRTFLGEEVTGTAAPDFSDAATSRVVPFFLQDLNDAMREEGLIGAALGMPGLIGFSVQSYSTVADVRNELAGALQGKSWDELTGVEQQALEEQFRADFEGVRVRSDFTERKDEIEADIRARETQLAQALAEGAPARQVAEQLDVLDIERRARVNEAMINAGIAPRDDPNDPVQRVFDLREAAQRNGIIDFELLDEMTEGLLASMSAADRRQYEERRRFIHAPEIQSFFDARRYISERTGYWDVRAEEMERLLPTVQRIEPAINTYQQLVFAVNRAAREDPQRALRLGRLLSVVDSRTSTRRDRLRRADQLLDDALVLVYGMVPIRQRRR